MQWKCAGRNGVIILTVIKEHAVNKASSDKQTVHSKHQSSK